MDLWILDLWIPTLQKPHVVPRCIDFEESCGSLRWLHTSLNPLPCICIALHTPPLLGGTLPENHSVEKENFAPHRFSNWCLCRMASNLQHCNALSSSFTVDFHTFLQWMCPTRKICRSWTCPSFLQASMFIVCDPSQPGARPRPSRDGWWWFPTSTYHGLPSSILNNFHSLSSLSHFNLCLLDSNQFCLCQHTIETTGDTSY